jgi:hypothetical protein
MRSRVREELHSAHGRGRAGATRPPRAENSHNVAREGRAQRARDGSEHGRIRTHAAPDHERAPARRELVGDLGHELRSLRRQPARASHRRDTSRKGQHSQLAARHPHQRGQPQGQQSGQGGRIGRHAHRPAAAGEPPHGERAAAPPAPRGGEGRGGRWSGGERRAKPSAKPAEQRPGVQLGGRVRRIRRAARTSPKWITPTHAQQAQRSRAHGRGVETERAPLDRVFQ